MASQSGTSACRVPAGQGIVRGPGRDRLVRRAWRCIAADGLLGITTGCLLLGSGAVAALEGQTGLTRLTLLAVFSVSALLALLALVAGKFRITAPRMVWADLERMERVAGRRAWHLLGLMAALCAGSAVLALVMPAEARPIAETLAGCLVGLALPVGVTLLLAPSLVPGAAAAGAAIAGAGALHSGWPLLAGGVALLAVGAGSLSARCHRNRVVKSRFQSG